MSSIKGLEDFEIGMNLSAGYQRKYDWAEEFKVEAIGADWAITRTPEGVPHFIEKGEEFPLAGDFNEPGEFDKYFVLLNNSAGGDYPLLDHEGEIVWFPTKEAASLGGKGSVVGNIYGYRVYYVNAINEVFLNVW